MFGPDVKASVNIEQLKQIVEGTKFISTMLQCDVNFDERDENREALKGMFSKSLYAVEDLEEGTILTSEMFKAKKPNIGLEAKQVNNIIGKKINKRIKKNEPLKEEDVQ